MEEDDTGNIDKGKKGSTGGETTVMEEGLSEVELEERSVREKEKEGRLNGGVISNKQAEEVKIITNGEEAVREGRGNEEEFITVVEE